MYADIGNAAVAQTVSLAETEPSPKHTDVHTVTRRITVMLPYYEQRPPGGGRHSMKWWTWRESN